MDRAQLLNDSEEALRIALDSFQSSVWTAMPGIVQSVDLSTMTCEVQPSIQGIVTDENDVTQNVNYPKLVDVPIVFPSAGGFLITFPLAVGDEVLVVFASRCIDSWWQSGGTSNQPMEARMHDLSDGFAIPGPRSQVKLPAGSISSSDLQIRNDAGTVFLAVTAAGKFSMVNATTDLKTVLTGLESALSAFMTTLAGFSGGGSPTTQAMLAAPAATAEAALATVLTEIGALLS